MMKADRMGQECVISIYAVRKLNRCCEAIINLYKTCVMKTDQIHGRRIHMVLRDLIQTSFGILYYLKNIKNPINMDSQEGR